MKIHDKIYDVCALKLLMVLVIQLLKRCNCNGGQGLSCMHRCKHNFGFKTATYISKLRNHECHGNGVSQIIAE
jgi:hypothetical protein